MENLLNIASYVNNRYFETKGERIDEMKLHKMLYFAQRESLIQKNEPLFAETFYGWKYGPILKEIRNAYRDNTFLHEIEDDVVCRIKSIMDINDIAIDAERVRLRRAGLAKLGLV